MTLIAATRTHDATGNLKALVETGETDVLRKPCGSLHYSPNYLGNLMIVGRRSVGESGTAETVYLSSDGRGFPHEWHRGAQDTPVYVEIHGAVGCRFHGWIDSVTRRIVQAG